MMVERHGLSVQEVSELVDRLVEEHPLFNAEDLYRLAREAGFTGDICDDCGSSQMVRNGTCLKCNSCGATTGCS